MCAPALAFLPLSVDAGDVRVAITETDLDNYPGLYLYNPDGTNSLKGKHAPYPTETVDGGYNNIQSVVTGTADYIARVDGARTFPWRILVLRRASPTPHGSNPARLRGTGGTAGTLPELTSRQASTHLPTNIISTSPLTTASNM